MYKLTVMAINQISTDILRSIRVGRLHLYISPNLEYNIVDFLNIKRYVLVVL